MKITVVGTGYVGLIAGLGFSKWGNQVVCLDVDQKKIDLLNQGICPIYEPGATTMLKEGMDSGRLRFTCDTKAAVEHGQLIFIAVGTPEASDGSADMKYVYAVTDNIAEYMQSYKVVVDKSTVPVGTAAVLTERIARRLRELGKNIDFEVASNPEFLREGKAVRDFDNPDRVVLGVRGERAKELLLRLYQGFQRSNKPIVVTTPETAEMIKYASNAFLATKITFINEIANLCERVGADALQVAAAMGKDGRIGPKFLHPGPGYGGSCFPKDTKALADVGVKYGARQTLVECVIEANRRQKEKAAQKILNYYPDGATLSFLGLSFKPETDDIRESPAISIVKVLLGSGKFTLRLYDPKAMENAKKELGESERLVWCPSVEDTVPGVDGIVIATEWSDFNALDFETFKGVVKKPVLFDLRNLYQIDDVRDAGFQYIGTGI